MSKLWKSGHRAQLKFSKDTPILFLDIDGVLNSGDWYTIRNRFETPPEGIGVRDWADIDPTATKRLNRIVDETGCFIVLSSTWRQLKSLKYMRNLLSRRGLREPKRLIDKTPDGWRHEKPPLWEPVQRGKECLLWREQTGHAGLFCALDDDGDFDDMIDYLVQTNNRTGLLDSHVDEVIAMLKGKDDDK